MDRRRAAGHRRARRHRSHHPRASLLGEPLWRPAGAERLLGRQCSLARRVGATPRHRQRLCPARRTGSRSGSGYRCRPRAARLGGNATRHGRRGDQAAGLDLVADGSGIPAEVIVPQAYHVPTRRELLLGSTALVAAAFVPGTVRAEGRHPRLLTIVLRGAVDGLAVVAPVGDPNWTKLRGDKALALDGAAPALPLDGSSPSNPAMPNLHRLYHAGQATIVHAVATPYRERSHFDGQDVLESGYAKPGAADSGWLNRAGRRARALRTDRFATTPWLCRRADRPARRARPGAGAVLGPAATAAGQRRDDDAPARSLSPHRPGARAGARRAHRARRDRARRRHRQRARRGSPRGPDRRDRASAQILRRGGGCGGEIPDAGRRSTGRRARLGTGGTPTSTRVRSKGRLANLLGALDGAVAGVETNMGEAWRETVVVIVTEFGRTARINGNDGTDHGTANRRPCSSGALSRAGAWSPTGRV